MKKFIKAGNLPPSFGVTSLAVWLLVAERLSSPAWVYGALGAVYTIYVIVVLIQLWQWTAVDIFEEKK
jgi:hypothetical protein